jgi:GTPase SAR1 family protein
MFVEVITSALLERAWHERAAIVQLGKDLLDASRRGKFKLFIFGPGGVGKTVLGKLLSGEYSLETVPPDYDLSLETEEGSVAGRYFTSVYVPPGQEEKRGYTWDELYRELQSAERYAIINVCCWGYHSLARIEFARHKLYSAGMTEVQFLPLFLEEQRFAELRVLEELLPQFKTAPNKFRMLTLITKQDLWWMDRHQVQTHYEKGRYNELIDALRNHKGAANFSHDYVSASLNLLNFRTKDVLLTQTVAGYDNALRIANFNNAVRSIRGLMS